MKTRRIQVTLAVLILVCLAITGYSTWIIRQARQAAALSLYESKVNQEVSKLLMEMVKEWNVTTAIAQPGVEPSVLRTQLLKFRHLVSTMQDRVKTLEQEAPTKYSWATERRERHLERLKNLKKKIDSVEAEADRIQRTLDRQHPPPKERSNSDTGSSLV